MGNNMNRMPLSASISGSSVTFLNLARLKPLISRFNNVINSWQFGLTGWLVLNILTLVANVVSTIYVALDRPIKDGTSYIYIGKCGEMQQLNTWLHILINALGGALISGRNYCMQCLSAPTRGEVDAAHRRRTNLDIGIPSLTNFQFMKQRKFFLWMLFGITSLPLYLLYE